MILSSAFDLIGEIVNFFYVLSLGGFNHLI